MLSIIKDYFYGQKVALGTKHNKELVIAPLFKSELSMNVVVPPDLDTDKFGTFTLDHDRPGNQKETSLIKAKAAMELTGLDMGLASEGIFGSHPALPFSIANTEVVVFVDRKHDLEIFGGHVEAVNYAQSQSVESIDEVMLFAKRINFPKHGIVVREAEKKYKSMVKGITNEAELIKVTERLLRKYRKLWIETDFRAHVNKSRMNNIAKATEDLIANIKRLCPKCKTPGFHRVSPKPGLPCETCGRPTDLPLYDVYKCDKCNHEQDVKYPNQKHAAYAGYCDYCNP